MKPASTRFVRVFCMLVVLGSARAALAQHVHGETPEVEARGETAPAEPSTSRDGSGTSWVPESTPMRAFHANAEGWRLMLHGQLNAGFDWQGTDRGDGNAISTNWVMAMADHDLAGGELGLRTMLSLEPATVGDDGYPLLLQSGETSGGMPLVDRQHPHDLFMELAARYRHPIAGGVGLEIYGGPAGEPALGPVAFPHRPSAMLAPLAPLGHHWLDSSHITFGVATVGVTSSRVKLEASAFNGREPDEDRWDLDLRGFDSWSARVQVAPVRDVALQLSYGHLNAPEALHPGIDVQRWTASVLHGTSIAPGYLASTLAWGRNDPSEGPSTNALLAESALDGRRWGGPFVRLEVVEKAGEDLAMDALPDRVFTVYTATAGYHVPLAEVSGIESDLGAQLAITDLPDAALAARYGDSVLYGAMAFITLRPTTTKHRHR